MRKILFILLLLSGRAMSQTSTPPVMYVITNGDTTKDYWDAQRIIDYVATHGGGGSGWPSPQTGDVIVDAAGYTSAFENVGESYVTNYTGTTYTDLLSQPGSAHYNISVGGNQVIAIDSGTNTAIYGADGNTYGAWDGIGQTYTINAPYGIYASSSYNVNDVSQNVTASIFNGQIQTLSADGSVGTDIYTKGNGTQNYYRLFNANGAFDLSLDVTGTTFSMALPAYANDAAAGLAGLQTGAQYQDLSGVNHTKQ